MATVPLDSTPNPPREGKHQYGHRKFDIEKLLSVPKSNETTSGGSKEKWSAEAAVKCASPKTTALPPPVLLHSNFGHFRGIRNFCSTSGCRKACHGDKSCRLRSCHQKGTRLNSSALQKHNIFDGCTVRDNVKPDAAIIQLVDQKVSPLAVRSTY